MKSKISFNIEVSLIEIIISVLILAISGVIILNCFAMARFTQIKSNDKVIASIKAQTILELLKSTSNIDDIEKKLQNYYSEQNLDKDKIVLLEYYDKQWKKCLSENNEYLMTVEIISTETISGSLNDINISIEKDKPYPFIKSKDEPLVSINSKKFHPIVRGL